MCVNSIFSWLVHRVSSEQWEPERCRRRRGCPGWLPGAECPRGAGHRGDDGGVRVRHLQRRGLRRETLQRAASTGWGEWNRRLPIPESSVMVKRQLQDIGLEPGEKKGLGCFGSRMRTLGHGLDRCGRGWVLMELTELCYLSLFGFFIGLWESSVIGLRVVNSSLLPF